jgi:hypothetical protein
MTDMEVEKVAKAVVNTKAATPEKKGEVFDEIKQRVVSGHHQIYGGLHFATDPWKKPWDHAKQQRC